MKRLVPFAAALALALVPALARPAPPVALKTLELGSGPPIVFVHELGSRGMAWLPVAKKLLAGHQAVLVDLPGHGASPMPESFSLAAAADALDQVLVAHPDAVVVGHGVGGLVALYAAKAHPEHLRGLVLVEAGAKGLDVPEQQKSMFLDFVDREYDAFLRTMFTGLARDSAQAVTVHAQAAMVPAATFKAYLRELLYADPSRAVKGLATPVLYVGSAKQWPDGRDWPAVARERGLDTARRAMGVRIPDAGHYVMDDQPDSLAARVGAFAAETVAGN